MRSFCRMLFCRILVASALVPLAAQAQAQSSGWIDVAPNRQVYAQYVAPAPGKPTMVLLNGLTYRIGSWDPFVRQFAGEGYGILRYDPAGQGQTLLRYAPITEAVRYQDQISDLRALLTQLNIVRPVLVGLSYGGAMAIEYLRQFPRQVASVVLIAPFLEPLAQQDQMIRANIAQTRILFPLNPATDDELYDYFLRNIVYSTYPAAEPIVLENPFKLEATFRLVQGIRKWRAADVVQDLPPGRIHLVVATQDQYVERSVYEQFWNSLTARQQVSALFVSGVEHKMPEAAPEYTANWVRLILNGDPRLRGGRVFTGSVSSGRAENGRDIVEVR